MTNIALAVRRERCPRSSERVAARAIGPPLTADVSGMTLVRELRPEGLPLRKRHNLWLHCFDPLVAIGADAELRRSEFLYVAGYAGSMTGHHRLNRIRPSNMAPIALDLAVLRRSVVEPGTVGLARG